MLCVSNRWDWKCCSGLGKKGSLYLQALNTDFSANRWFVWWLKYEVITAKKSRLSKLNLGSWCWSCTQKLELATRKVFENSEAHIRDPEFFRVEKIETLSSET